MVRKETTATGEYEVGPPPAITNEEPPSLEPVAPSSVRSNAPKQKIAMQAASVETLQEYWVLTPALLSPPKIHSPVAVPVLNNGRYEVLSLMPGVNSFLRGEHELLLKALSEPNNEYEKAVHPIPRRKLKKGEVYYGNIWDYWDEESGNKAFSFLISSIRTPELINEFLKAPGLPGTACETFLKTRKDQLNNEDQTVNMATEYRKLEVISNPTQVALETASKQFLEKAG